MEAGRLDRRILLYRPAYAYDAANQLVTTWPQANAIGPLPARKFDVSDGEQVQAQQVGASLTARFHIRRSAQVAGVNATWQLGLLEAGVEVARFELKGVKDLLRHGDHGRRVGLELTALAQVDGPAPPES